MKSFKKIAAALSAAAITVTSVSALALSASAADDESMSYSAFLCFQAGGDSQWKAGDLEGGEAVTITGDGSYSTGVTMVTGSESIEAIILSTDINVYDFAPEGDATNAVGIPENCTAKIVVDSIVIERVDGTTDTTAITYSGPSDGALRTNDDGTTMRLNILNVWQSPNINDIGTGSNCLPTGGLMSGDKVVVNFSVSGLVKAERTTKYGDVDGNGSVEIADAFQTLMESSRISAGSEAQFDEAKTTIADVDGNGKIEIRDAFLILFYSSKLAVDSEAKAEDYFPVLQ